MNRPIREGQRIRIDGEAASTDAELPAFIARPDDAPVYHGFPVLKDSEIEGWRFGTISDPNGQEPREYGDAFVIAPNGSRAGVVWQAGEGESHVVCAPDMRRWGVYGFYFDKPVRSDRDLIHNLQSKLPELKRYFDTASFSCPDSTSGT